MKPLVFVFLRPGTDVGQRPQTVDAGIRPEIDQHHMALERSPVKRRRVDPIPRRQDRAASAALRPCRRVRRHHHHRRGAFVPVRMTRSTSDCSIRMYSPAITASARRDPIPRRSRHARQDRDSQHAANPNLRAQRSLQRTEYAAAGQQRDISDVAAPAAYASSSSVVRVLAPSTAAPVSISPRIGPAHGAQSNPVATPKSND